MQSIASIAILHVFLKEAVTKTKTVISLRAKAPADMFERQLEDAQISVLNAASLTNLSSASSR